MLDIVTYRVRIGTFIPRSKKKHKFHLLKKMTFRNRKFTSSTFSYLKRNCLSLIFICTLLSVYSWIPIDTRSLKNCQRGTNFTSLKYRNMKKQSLRNYVRYRNSFVAQKAICHFSKNVEKTTSILQIWKLHKILISLLIMTIPN